LLLKSIFSNSAKLWSSASSICINGKMIS
jgi:hypothetical protein